MDFSTKILPKYPEASIFSQIDCKKIYALGDFTPLIKTNKKLLLDPNAKKKSQKISIWVLKRI